MRWEPFLDAPSVGGHRFPINEGQIVGGGDSPGHMFHPTPSDWIGIQAERVSKMSACSLVKVNDPDVWVEKLV